MIAAAYLAPLQVANGAIVASTSSGIYRTLELYFKLITDAFYSEWHNALYDAVTDGSAVQ